MLGAKKIPEVMGGSPNESRSLGSARAQMTFPRHHTSTNRLKQLKEPRIMPRLTKRPSQSDPQPQGIRTVTDMGCQDKPALYARPFLELTLRSRGAHRCGQADIHESIVDVTGGATAVGERTRSMSAVPQMAPIHS